MDEWAAFLSREVPGPGTAGWLSVLEAGELSPSGRVDALAALERHAEWIQALQVRVLAGLEAEPVDPFPGEGSPAVGVWDFTCEQVACALRISHDSAASRLATARELAGTFPVTLGLLEAGRIHYMQARAVVEVTEHLPRETAVRVEALVAERMPEQAVSATRKALHRAVLKADPAGAEARHRSARADRRVTHRMDLDGMAWWSAYLPAEQAAGLDAAVDTHAHAIKDGAQDTRTLEQRRVDALVDLVLHQTGPHHRTPLANRTGTRNGNGNGAAVPPNRTPSERHGAGAAVQLDGTPAQGTEGRVEVGATVPFNGTPAHEAGHGAEVAVRLNGTAGRESRDGAGVPFGGTPAHGAETGAETGAESGDGDGAGVRLSGTTGRSGPVVQVTVSFDTLIGADDQPAELKGYGPITAGQARALACQPGSIWRRLITHPETGMLIKTDPTTYRPTTETLRHVTARDARCAFPSCQMPAHRCDMDHIRPFNHHHPETGGPSTPENLMPLCRRHHLLKHHAGWTVQRHTTTGHTTWTAPTGHTYTNTPHHYAA